MNTPATLPRSKVLLVEDSQLVRDHLTALLDALPRMERVGVAETAAEAIEAVARCVADIVILDVLLKAGSGLDVLRMIRRRHSRCAVIVFTNHTDVHRSYFYAAGADWFLSQSRDHGRLEQLLRSFVGRHGGCGCP